MHVASAEEFVERLGGGAGVGDGGEGFVELDGGGEGGLHDGCLYADIHRGSWYFLS